jgi:TetR/AcrR family transcriptional regulator, fatty acid metabolism regulator protein
MSRWRAPRRRKETILAYRTTPKMAARKERQHAHLLETAIALFGRHGYHATTVPMIVKAAGSSTGSFYFYFRNKEDVFAAAQESFGTRIAAALNQAIAAAPPGPAEKMRAAVQRLVTFMAENPDEARILIVESSGLDARLQEIRRRIVASHAGAVEKAITLLRPELNAEVTARCWVGSVYEAVFHWLEQPAAKRPPAAEVARAVADFNLRGIGAL